MTKKCCNAEKNRCHVTTPSPLNSYLSRIMITFLCPLGHCCAEVPLFLEKLSHNHLGHKKLKKFFSFFFRDKLLSSEKSLRQQLETELAEKTEELYKEKVMSKHGETGRYSPMNLTSSFGNDSTSIKEELSHSQRLNLQVICFLIVTLFFLEDTVI